jgi:hypothetical protein
MVQLYLSYESLSFHVYLYKTFMHLPDNGKGARHGRCGLTTTGIWLGGGIVAVEPELTKGGCLRPPLLMVRVK